MGSSRARCSRRSKVPADAGVQSRRQLALIRLVEALHQRLTPSGYLRCRIHTARRIGSRHRRSPIVLSTGADICWLRVTHQLVGLEFVSCRRAEHSAAAALGVGRPAATRRQRWQAACSQASGGDDGGPGARSLA